MTTHGAGTGSMIFYVLREDEIMGKRNFQRTGFITLSGAYPTREALESELLSPSFARTPRLVRDARAPFSDPLFAVDSMGEELFGCATSAGHDAGATCEFRDFCNHLYTMEFACDCEVAWKKRAGLALPTLT